MIIYRWPKWQEEILGGKDDFLARGAGRQGEAWQRVAAVAFAKKATPFSRPVQAAMLKLTAAISEENRTSDPVRP